LTLDRTVQASLHWCSERIEAPQCSEERILNKVIHLNRSRMCQQGAMHDSSVALIEPPERCAITTAGCHNHLRDFKEFPHWLASCVGSFRHSSLFKVQMTIDIQGLVWWSSNWKSGSIP
jgi:hypothetical protein